MPTMAIYKITTDKIEPLPATSFALRGIKERSDLQRLLRANINVIAPDVLVIAEEFGEWDGARRRIDLLGVDAQANLVVIELKRGDDGEHMDLQAIRYAAMVSGMTFSRAVQTYQEFLERSAAGKSALDELLRHLGWDSAREDDFAQDVRIVLVSGDFSKELTTAVLWLNERDLDIRCVRIKPYANGEETIVDVQQVVPLPEAEEYMVQVKEKGQAQRAEKAERDSDLKAFWTAALPVVASVSPRWRNISPANEGWLAVTSGKPGITFQLWSYTNMCGTSLYIDAGPTKPAWAKAVFDFLHSNRAEIESALQAPLEWSRLDEKRASIIASESINHGYRSSRTEWPAVHANLAEQVRRFEEAILPWLDTAITSANASI